jgi:hypothetical protein
MGEITPPRPAIANERFMRGGRLRYNRAERRITMSRFLRLTGLATGLLLAAPAAGLADESDKDWRERFQYDFRIEGLDKLMQGVDELLRSVPRFETPFIDENGDIIIRRAPPRGLEWDPFQPPADPDFADI